MKPLDHVPKQHRLATSIVHGAVGILMCGMAIAALTRPLAAQSDTLTIGVAVPDGGPYAVLGDLIRTGAQVAIDEINAGGGVSGRRLSLTIAEDGCSTDEGRDAANQLVGAGARLAIGHLCYSATRAAIPVYQQADVIHMTVATQVPALTLEDRVPGLFRLAPRDDRASPVIAAALRTAADEGPIALVHDESIYGRTLVDAIRQDLVASGTGPALLSSFEPGATRFDDLVASLRDENVSAIFVASYHEDTAALARALTAARLRPAIIVPETGANAEMKTLAGDAINRMTVVKPVDWIAPDLLSRHNVAETVAARYFLGAHTAVTIWTDAVMASGSDQAELLARTIQTAEFDTAIGSLRFTGTGDLADIQFAPHRWVGGRLEPVD